MLGLRAYGDPHARPSAYRDHPAPVRAPCRLQVRHRLAAGNEVPQEGLYDHGLGLCSCLQRIGNRNDALRIAQMKRPHSDSLLWATCLCRQRSFDSNPMQAHQLHALPGNRRGVGEHVIVSQPSPCFELNLKGAELNGNIPATSR